MNVFVFMRFSPFVLFSHLDKDSKISILMQKLFQENKMQSFATLQVLFCHVMICL